MSPPLNTQNQISNLIISTDGHHTSSNTPTEEDHLTIVCFSEAHEKKRSLCTAHVYIPDTAQPWTGEWYKHSPPKPQGPATVDGITTALSQAEVTLDVTGKTVSFKQVDKVKPRKT